MYVHILCTIFWTDVRTHIMYGILNWCTYTYYVRYFELMHIHILCTVFWTDVHSHIMYGILNWCAYTYYIRYLNWCTYTYFQYFELIYVHIFPSWLRSSSLRANKNGLNLRLIKKRRDKNRVLLVQWEEKTMGIQWEEETLP